MPWCPKHGWEFSFQATVCPACGTPLVAERPEGAEPDSPREEAGQEPGEVAGASRLGTFDRLAAPVLLDLLGERGIRAFEAPPLANPATRAWDPMGLDVWVETQRLPEARAIAEEELPALLRGSSITPGTQTPEESGRDSIFDDDVAVEEEEAEPGDDEAATDEDDIPVEWSSFGWMELAPARVFLEICDEEGIPMRTEFPLDAPPPPWAADFGRVSVEVDRYFVADAEALLATLEERLDERGIEWNDPLCDLAGP